MFKLQTLKLGFFFILLLMHFPLHADDTYKAALAEKYTAVMYPAEFYVIHEPYVNELVKKLDIDSKQWSHHEKSALKAKLAKIFLVKSSKCLIAARMEVYTEDELDLLLEHFQTDLGKQVINKIRQAKNKSFSYNPEEIAFNNEFAVKYRELNNKLYQVYALYIKKFSNQATELGQEVALLMGAHEDAYQNKKK